MIDPFPMAGFTLSAVHPGVYEVHAGDTRSPASAPVSAAMSPEALRPTIREAATVNAAGVSSDVAARIVFAS